MLRVFVLVFVLGFLLWPVHASAQMTVAGPPTPTAHALTAWAAKHIPAKFQAVCLLEVSPLSDFGMDDYLHDGDHSQNNSHGGDDDEIDGVFVNHPPRILLRIPNSGRLDFATFAHEYGHYVWFDLLTNDDRKRYKALYDRQKAARKLVTSYAAESVEEGFAEAFAAETTSPAALLRADPLSAKFLADWPPKR